MVRIVVGRPLRAFLLGATLAAAAFAAHAAYGALTTETDVIDACYQRTNGNVYLIGRGTGRAECREGDVAISWNVQGPQGLPGTPGANGKDGEDGRDGEDGISVTGAALPVGDANCANGGTAFTAANGTSYVCNGANGADGADGQDGRDGAPGTFTGRFESPNGVYSISVTNVGIKIESALGPELELAGSTLALRNPGAITLHGGLVNLTGTPVVVTGTPVSITGSPLQLTCTGGTGALRGIDVVAGVGAGGGPIVLNPAGAPLTRIC